MNVTRLLQFRPKNVDFSVKHLHRIAVRFAKLRPCTELNLPDAVAELEERDGFRIETMRSEPRILVHPDELKPLRSILSALIGTVKEGNVFKSEGARSWKRFPLRMLKELGYECMRLTTRLVQARNERSQEIEHEVRRRGDKMETRALDELQRRRPRYCQTAFCEEREKANLTKNHVRNRALGGDLTAPNREECCENCHFAGNEAVAVHGIPHHVMFSIATMFESLKLMRRHEEWAPRATNRAGVQRQLVRITYSGFGAAYFRECRFWLQELMLIADRGGNLTHTQEEFLRMFVVKYFINAALAHRSAKKSRTRAACAGSSGGGRDRRDTY